MSINHRDIITTAIGDIKFFTVRRECHIPRALADGDDGDDFAGGGIDHAEVVVAAIANVNAAAIGIDLDAVRTQADLDVGLHFPVGGGDNL